MLGVAKTEAAATITSLLTSALTTDDDDSTKIRVNDVITSVAVRSSTTGSAADARSPLSTHSDVTSSNMTLPKRPTAAWDIMTSPSVSPGVANAGHRYLATEFNSTTSISYNIATPLSAAGEHTLQSPSNDMMTSNTSDVAMPTTVDITPASGPQVNASTDELFIGSTVSEYTSSLDSETNLPTASSRQTSNLNTSYVESQASPSNDTMMSRVAMTTSSNRSVTFESKIMSTDTYSDSTSPSYIEKSSNIASPGNDLVTSYHVTTRANYTEVLTSSSTSSATRYRPAESTEQLISYDTINVTSSDDMMTPDVGTSTTDNITLASGPQVNASTDQLFLGSTVSEYAGSLQSETSLPPASTGQTKSPNNGYVESPASPSNDTMTSYDVMTTANYSEVLTSLATDYKPSESIDQSVSDVTINVTSSDEMMTSAVVMSTSNDITLASGPQVTVSTDQLVIGSTVSEYVGLLESESSLPQASTRLISSPNNSYIESPASPGNDTMTSLIAMTTSSDGSIIVESNMVFTNTYSDSTSPSDIGKSSNAASPSNDVVTSYDVMTAANYSEVLTSSSTSFATPYRPAEGTEQSVSDVTINVTSSDDITTSDVVVPTADDITLASGPQVSASTGQLFVGSTVSEYAGSLDSETNLPPASTRHTGSLNSSHVESPDFPRNDTMTSRAAMTTISGGSVTVERKTMSTNTYSESTVPFDTGHSSYAASPESPSNDTMTSNTSDVVMSTSVDITLASGPQLSASNYQQFTSSTVSEYAISLDSETNVPPASTQHTNSPNSSYVESPLSPSNDTMTSRAAMTTSSGGSVIIFSKMMSTVTYSDRTSPSDIEKSSNVASRSNELVTSSDVMTTANYSEVLTSSSALFATHYRPAERTDQSVTDVAINVTSRDDMMTSAVVMSTSDDITLASGPQVNASTDELFDGSTVIQYGGSLDSETNLPPASTRQTSSPNSSYVELPASLSNDTMTSRIPMTTSSGGSVTVERKTMSTNTYSESTVPFDTGQSSYVASPESPSNDTMTSNTSDVVMSTIADITLANGPQVNTSTDRQFIGTLDTETNLPTASTRETKSPNSNYVESPSSPSNDTMTSRVAMTTSSGRSVTVESKMMSTDTYNGSTSPSDIGKPSNAASPSNDVVTSYDVLTTANYSEVLTSSFATHHRPAESDVTINVTSSDEMMTSDVVMSTTADTTLASGPQVNVSTDKQFIASTLSEYAGSLDSETSLRPASTRQTSNADTSYVESPASPSNDAMTSQFPMTTSSGGSVTVKRMTMSTHKYSDNTVPSDTGQSSYAASPESPSNDTMTSYTSDVVMSTSVDITLASGPQVNASTDQLFTGFTVSEHFGSLDTEVSLPRESTRQTSSFNSSYVESPVSPSNDVVTSYDVKTTANYSEVLLSSYSSLVTEYRPVESTDQSVTDVTSNLTASDDTSKSLIVTSATAESTLASGPQVNASTDQPFVGATVSEYAGSLESETNLPPASTRQTSSLTSSFVESSAFPSNDTMTSRISMTTSSGGSVTVERIMKSTHTYSDSTVPSDTGQSSFAASSQTPSNDTMTSNTSDVVMSTSVDITLASGPQVNASTDQQFIVSTLSEYAGTLDTETDSPPASTRQTSSPNSSYEESPASPSNDTMTSRVAVTTSSDGSIILETKMMSTDTYSGSTSRSAIDKSSNAASPSNELVTSYDVMTTANYSEMLTSSSTSSATHYKPAESTEQLISNVTINVTSSDEMMMSNVVMSTSVDTTLAIGPQVNASTDELFTGFTVSEYGGSLDTETNLPPESTRQTSSPNSSYVELPASPSNDTMASRIPIPTTNGGSVTVESKMMFTNTYGDSTSPSDIDNSSNAASPSNDLMISNTSDVVMSTSVDITPASGPQVYASTDELFTGSTASKHDGSLDSETTLPPATTQQPSSPNSSYVESPASPSNGFMSSYDVMTTANYSEVLTLLATDYKPSESTDQSVSDVTINVTSSDEMMTSAVVMSTTADITLASGPQVNASTDQRVIGSTVSESARSLQSETSLPTATTRQTSSPISRYVESPSSPSNDLVTSYDVMTTANYSEVLGSSSTSFPTPTSEQYDMSMSTPRTHNETSSSQFISNRGNTTSTIIQLPSLSPSNNTVSTDIAMTTTNENVPANSTQVDLTTSTQLLSESTSATYIPAQSGGQFSSIVHVSTTPAMMSRFVMPTTDASVRASSPQVELSTSENFNESTSSVYDSNASLPTPRTSQSSNAVQSPTSRSNNTVTSDVTMTIATDSAQSEQYTSELVTSVSVGETTQQSSSDSSVQLSTSPSNDVTMTTSTKSVQETSSAKSSSSSSDVMSSAIITSPVNVFTPVLTSRDSVVTSLGVTSAAVADKSPTSSASGVTGSTSSSIGSPLVTSTVTSLMMSLFSDAVTSPAVTGTTRATGGTDSHTTTTTTTTSTSRATTSTTTPTSSITTTSSTTSSQTSGHTASPTGSAQSPSSRHVTTSSRPVHSEMTSSPVAMTTTTNSSTSVTSTVAMVTSDNRISTSMTSHRASRTSSPVVMTISRSAVTSSVSTHAITSYMTSGPAVSGRQHLIAYITCLQSYQIVT